MNNLEEQKNSESGSRHSDGPMQKANSDDDASTLATELKGLDIRATETTDASSFFLGTLKRHAQNESPEVREQVRRVFSYGRKFA